MQLTVNDQPTTLTATDGSPPTITELLAHMGLQDKPCAVEVNRTLIPKRDHAQHTLSEGDTVELVSLVGGG